MFATSARTDPVEPPVRPWVADADGTADAADAADIEDDDPLRPARGIGLGAALGFISIVALGLVARWLF